MAEEHLKRASAEEIGQVAGIKVPRFSTDDRFFANPRKKETTSARCSTAKADERKKKQEREKEREREGGNNRGRERVERIHEARLLKTSRLFFL